MFENLKAEMSRKGLTMMDFSKDTELGLSYETLRNKFSGKTEWNKREMFLLKKKYFKDKTIEYLFEQK
jgi:lambda repressor-like predicted transcriptional regulator